MRTGGDLEPRSDASVDVAVSRFRVGALLQECRCALPGFVRPEDLRRVDVGKVYPCSYSGVVSVEPVSP